ncbi:hypothetical protein LguiA_032877 [Lonicera macranthoides]
MLAAGCKTCGNDTLAKSGHKLVVLTLKHPKISHNMLNPHIFIAPPLPTRSSPYNLIEIFTN